MIGPHPNATGGISTVVSNWIEADIDKLIQLDYISTLDNVAPGFSFKKIRDALKAYLTFIGKNKNDIDIVHIHLSHGMSFYRKLGIFFISKIKSLKVITHLHGSKFEEFYYNGSKTRQKLIKYLFDNSTAIIALSDAWKKFIQLISKNENIKILYNGASPEKFGVAHKDNTHIYISFMGRLGERKGIYDLLKAFEKLSPVFPQAYLILGGDGDVDKVKELVSQKKIADKVDVTGWVSGQDKINIFNKSDIYVLPSYNEGLPGSILEAMAAQTAVISTYVGGIPEAVIPEKNGLLIQAGDIDALYIALKRLCSDPKLTKKMGLASKELVTTKFNINDIVKQLHKIYEEVASHDRI